MKGNDELSRLIDESRQETNDASEALRVGLDKHASGEISAAKLGELIERSRYARTVEMTLVAQWVYVRKPDPTTIEEDND